MPKDGPDVIPFVTVLAKRDGNEVHAELPQLISGGQGAVRSNILTNCEQISRDDANIVRNMEVLGPHVVRYEVDRRAIQAIHFRSAEPTAGQSTQPLQDNFECQGSKEHVLHRSSTPRTSSTKAIGFARRRISRTPSASRRDNVEISNDLELFKQALSESNEFFTFLEDKTNESESMRITHTLYGRRSSVS